MKVQTTKIGGGADYAKVPARLKAFREKNPRAKVSTEPKYQEDGSCIFQATILSDKADINSAEATGTARYSAEEMKKIKAFEKLETISVGRALSLLGYMADGEIASSEEMEEFEDYKALKHFEKLEEYKELLESSQNLEELKTNWASIDGTFKKELEEIKNLVKQKYESKAI